MGWAQIVGIILQTIGPVVVDLIGALVDGDQKAHERVRDIIPSPLRSEALLISERARLARLDDGE